MQRVVRSVKSRPRPADRGWLVTSLLTLGLTALMGLVAAMTWQHRDLTGDLPGLTPALLLCGLALTWLGLLAATLRFRGAVLRRWQASALLSLLLHLWLIQQLSKFYLLGWGVSPNAVTVQKPEPAEDTLTQDLYIVPSEERQAFETPVLVSKPEKPEQPESQTPVTKQAAAVAEAPNLSAQTSAEPTSAATPEASNLARVERADEASTSPRRSLESSLLSRRETADAPLSGLQSAAESPPPEPTLTADASPSKPAPAAAALATAASDVGALAKQAEAAALLQPMENKSEAPTAPPQPAELAASQNMAQPAERSPEPTPGNALAAAEAARETSRRAAVEPLQNANTPEIMPPDLSDSSPLANANPAAAPEGLQAEAAPTKRFAEPSTEAQLPDLPSSSVADASPAGSQVTAESLQPRRLDSATPDIAQVTAAGPSSAAPRATAESAPQLAAGDLRAEATPLPAAAGETGTDTGGAASQIANAERLSLAKSQAAAAPAPLPDSRGFEQGQEAGSTSSPRASEFAAARASSSAPTAEIADTASSKLGRAVPDAGASGVETFAEAEGLPEARVEAVASGLDAGSVSGERQSQAAAASINPFSIAGDETSTAGTGAGTLGDRGDLRRAAAGGQTGPAIEIATGTPGRASTALPSGIVSGDAALAANASEASEGGNGEASSGQGSAKDLGPAASEMAQRTAGSGPSLAESPALNGNQDDGATAIPAAEMGVTGMASRAEAGDARATPSAGVQSGTGSSRQVVSAGGVDARVDEVAGTPSTGEGGKSDGKPRLIIELGESGNGTKRTAALPDGVLASGDEPTGDFAIAGVNSSATGGGPQRAERTDAGLPGDRSSPLAGMANPLPRTGGRATTATTGLEGMAGVETAAAEADSLVPAGNGSAPSQQALVAGETGLSAADGQIGRGAPSAGGLAVPVDADLGPGGLGTELQSTAGVASRRARLDSSVVSSDIGRFLKRDALGGPKIDGRTRETAESFAGRDRQPDGPRGGAASADGSKTEEAIERGLVYLAKIQKPDGRWSLHEEESARSGVKPINSDAAATGLALLSFLGAGYDHFGDRYQDEVQRGLDYLIKTQQADGSLYRPEDEYSNASAGFYSHAIAAMSLSEALGMTADEKLRPSAQRAVDYIVKTQHPQLGGWRYTVGSESDTSVTGWMLMSLKSGELAGLQVPRATYDGIEKWLKLAESPGSGGSKFVYNPQAGITTAQMAGRRESDPMTGVGLLMRLYLGSNRDSPSMQAGAAALRKNLPALGTSSLPQRDTYYWYYATQVMFHMRGEYWKEWNQRLHPLLVESQELNGPLAGSWNPLGRVPDRWGPHAGRVYVTTMNLLSLEVTYRHLPIYESTGK